MTNTEVWLGIDWTGGTPAARLAQPGSPSPARLVPLEGELCFRLSEPAVRYCAGWFDLSGPEARHVVCQSWQRLDKGRQCRRCQYLEGFIVAHQGYQGSLADMPPNLRDYLAQPHRLYVDVFADGSSKVGTVAEQRLADRLSEQGPVAACYVARTRDGLEARRLEAAMSKRLELPQAVSTTRKLRGLASTVDVASLGARLLDLASQSAALVTQLAGEGDWSPIDPPESWRPPATSAAVFARTPLATYPGQLTSGEHSLHIHGMSGAIAMVATAPGDDPVLCAANLGQLLGAELEFGDFQSSVPAVAQTALF
jgi:Protein of unknown function (DUF2797)